MNIEEELLPLERGLWTAGPDAYQRNVDEECLVAFTQMAGVMSRERIAATVSKGPRWRNLRVDVEGIVQPTDAMAILTYRASASRGEGAKERSYRALVSSGYVRRDTGWKLAFHQQTPLDADD